MPIVYCGQLFGKTNFKISSAGKSASKLGGISEDAGKPAWNIRYTKINPINVC